MFRLISLAPDIVEAILQNDAPDHLSLWSLSRGIALSWAGQRRADYVLFIERRGSAEVNKLVNAFRHLAPHPIGGCFH